MSKIKKINESNLSESLRAAGSKKSLLVFSASWCGPCKALNPILESIADNEFDVFKVDVDDNPTLSGMHDVRSIPSIFIYKDPERIADFVESNTGFVDDDSLVSVYSGPRTYVSLIEAIS